MKVGVSVTMINPGIRSDDAIYHDELSLIDLIEPLGFDSLVCVEHHFSAYAMIPNNLQLLSYVAGRTRRIQLVTAVIVLPWHDPIRVAEEVATLDVLSGGRAIFGFGRGSAPMEYEGFGVRMDESRQRFKEAAEIVIKGLPQERFSYDGQYFHIPRSASGRARMPGANRSDPRKNGHGAHRLHLQLRRDAARRSRTQHAPIRRPRPARTSSRSRLQDRLDFRVGFTRIKPSANHCVLTMRKYPRCAANRQGKKPNEHPKARCRGGGVVGSDDATDGRKRHSLH